ncbi:MAG: glycerol-3-phosphate dehydrogenase [Rhodospirillaceae bacterium]|nr:glycerol-3-phosphate dehydrogenase [Rhodospirillaceae bacterium]MAI49511.1 glycerol-3-phosphate dehydrogenase [Rhodospirillaceae bacterium]|tara:strand:- start:799 stop:2157 length:1359 start_codon:yes stop_codon:yes gene_type:complete
MSEGSLGAPERHPIPWQDSEFYDEKKLDAELRRQFDICHGCRRCHNLCDSFPLLFDLIDEAESMELDTVDSQDFKPVIDACTLCDMCFMTKCPYVPPHEFNLDVPHLMLRYRAVELKKGDAPFVAKQISKTDRNGKLAGSLAPLTNWTTERGNKLTRPVIQATAGIDEKAALPKFYSKTLIAQARKNPPARDADAPAKARKAVVYGTCFVNYNDPSIGMDVLKVLARNGVETEVLHPACCGMPKLEHGDIAGVAESAKQIAAVFRPWIEKGYDVVALTPSCSLMLKFEWPLILPDDDDIKLLSGSTHDISQYVVDIAKNEGLSDGMQPLDGPVTVHLACHSRAQNMGQKAAELLRLIPDSDVTVIERCSGHGGSWGMMKENFETAIKVGRPAARKAIETAPKYVVSECPLAGVHILQGMERLAEKETPPPAVPIHAPHPVQLLAQAYRDDRK